jgi:hypothetical protein
MHALCSKRIKVFSEKLEQPHSVQCHGGTATSDIGTGVAGFGPLMRGGNR